MILDSEEEEFIIYNFAIIINRDTFSFKIYYLKRHLKALSKFIIIKIYERDWK